MKRGLGLETRGLRNASGVSPHVFDFVAQADTGTLIVGSAVRTDWMDNCVLFDNGGLWQAEFSRCGENWIDTVTQWSAQRDPTETGAARDI